MNSKISRLGGCKSISHFADGVGHDFFGWHAIDSVQTRLLELPSLCDGGVHTNDIVVCK